MKSILIKDTTREEREEIVKKALWGVAERNASSAPVVTIVVVGGSKLSISHISMG